MSLPRRPIVFITRIVAVTVCLLATSWSSAQTTYTWIATGSANWNAAASWTPTSGSGTTFPSAVGDGAIFGTAITAPATVTLTAPVTVGAINFNNATSTYTVLGAAANTITLNNNAAAPVIAVSAGTTANQSIAAPIIVAGTSALQIANDSPTALLSLNTANAFALDVGAVGLTVTGAGAVSIGGTGTLAGSGTLTMNGAGLLTLAGSNTSFSGKIAVTNAGVLSISSLGNTGNDPGVVTPDAITLSGGGTLRNTATVTFGVNRGFTLGAGGGVIDNASTMTINGVIAGSGSLTKLGSSTLTLNAANTFTGAANFFGANGTVTLGGAAGALATTSVNLRGSTLTLGNTTTDVNSFRLADATVLTTRGSTLNVNNANTGASVNETIGSIVLDGSFNRFGGTANASQSTRLTVTGGITRNDNATALFRGPALGQNGSLAAPVVNTYYISFGTAPTLVGGGGAAGSTNISIIPWAFGDTSGTGTGTTTGTLVTYDAASGVRALNTTTEFATTIAPGSVSTNNVRAITGVTIDIGAADATINALSVFAGTVTGAGNLTLTSGTLLNSSTSSILSVGGLRFGPSGTGEALIFTPSNLTYNGPISAAGLTKAGGGDLVLGGNNTSLSGTINVHEGELILNNPNAAGTGSLIRLNGPGAAATLTLGFSGSFARNIQIGHSGTGTGAISAGEGQTVTYSGLVSSLPLAGGNVSFGNLSTSGTLILTNTANDFVGRAVYGGGTLAIANNAVLGNAANPLVLSSASSTLGALRFDAAFTVPRPVILEASSRVDTNGFDVTFSGVVSGSSAITKIGAGTLNLTAANTLTGTGTVSGGTLAFTGPNGAASSSGTYTAALGGTLLLDNTAANNPNRLGGGVTFTGGEFRLVGNAAVNATETVGVLTFSSGTSTATLVPGTGRSAILTAPSLSLTEGAVASFRGTNLGGGPTGTFSRIVFNTAPTLLGGLIPAATGDTSATGAGNNFVTYDATSDAAGVIGIRPLQSADYYTNSVIQNAEPVETPTSANVFVNGAVTTDPNPSANNLINSLTFGGATPTVTVTAGQTLTVATGGMLVQSGSTGAAISGGTVTAGTRPITLIANANFSFGSRLTGSTVSDGLVKVGPGTLTFSAANLLGNQALTVNEGVVSVAGFNQTAGSLSGSADGTLNVTSALTVTQASALTFAGTLNSTGTFTKLGSSTLTLAGPVTSTGPFTLGAGSLTATGSATFSGTLQVNSSGTLTLSGNATASGNVVVAGGGILSLSGPAVITTPASGSIVVRASTIDTVNTSGTANRIPDATTVALESGFLEIGGTDTAFTEVVTLTGRGYSGLTTDAMTGASVTLQAPALARVDNGTFLLRGDSLGSAPGTSNASNIFFTTAPTLSATGGGAAGSTTISIIPFAAGATSITGSASTLVTYTPATGVRPLNTTTEFAATLAGATQNTNVRIAATGNAAFPAGVTNVNSYAVAVASTTAYAAAAGGSTLRINSGTMLYTAGATLGAGTDQLTLDFAGQTAYVFGGTTTTMIVPARITGVGAGGLHVSGPPSGDITLSNAANDFPSLTINGSEGTTRYGVNFASAAPLGAANGLITLNNGSLTHTGSSVTTTLNRPVTINPAGGEFNSGTSPSGLTFAGANAVVSGSGPVTKSGTGLLTLGGSGTLSGPVTVSSGSLTIAGTTVLSNTVSVTVATSTLTVAGNASIGGDVSMTGASNVLVIDDTAAVNPNRLGGGLTFNGTEIRYLGNASAASSESIGPVTLTGGDKIITVVPGTNQSAVLTATSIASSATGILFRGTNLGGSSGTFSRIFLTGQPAGLIPNAVADNSATGTGIDLAFYDLTVGVRLLSSGDFITGPVIQNSAPVNIPTDAFFRVTSNATTTGGPADNNTIAALRLAPNSQLTVSNTLTVSGGNVTAESGGASTLTGGTVALSGTLATISTIGNLTLGSTLSVPSTGFTKAGAGTLTLTAANLLPSVPLDIQAGTIGLNNFNQTIGSLTGTATGTVALGTATLTVNQTSTGTYAGAITGSGALVKSGASTLTLNAPIAVTGPVTASQGILLLNGGGTLATTNLTIAGGQVSLDNATTVVADRVPNATPVAMNSGRLLLVGNNSITTVTPVTETIGAVSTTGLVALSVDTTTNAGGATLQVASLNRAATSTVLFRGDNLGTGVGNNGVGSVVFTSSIAGDLVGGGGGPGTVTISILPWAIGGTTPTSLGTTLVTYDPVNGVRPLVTATAGIEFDTFLFAGSTIPPEANIRILDPQPLQPGLIPANALVVATTSTTAVTGDASGTSVVQLASGALLFSSAGTIGGGANPMGLSFNNRTAYVSSGTSGTAVINANITNVGAAGLVFSSTTSGSLTLGGTNAFPALTVNGLSSSTTPANVNFATPANLGSGPITFNHGRLTYTGTTAIAFDRSLNVGAIGGSISVSSATGSLAFGGAASTLNGTGTFTKLGTGTLSLNPAAGSTFTGPIDVTAGRLNVDGTVPVATGAVTVSSGATLGGVGTINRPVSVLAGGFLSPGASPGTLTVNGAVTLSGTYNFEAGDLLQIGPSGSLTLGPASALVASGLDGTTTYTVANFPGGTLSGAFFNVSAAGYNIVYSTSSISLQPVPEPATVLAICGLAAGAWRLRRRFGLGKAAAGR